MREVFLHGFLANLRGILPEECADIVTTLYHREFRLFEVPIQAPEALNCISRMRERLPPDGLVGAGMVFNRDDIEAACQAGANLVISPHCDPELIRDAKLAGLACIAGAATPTEAFRAVKAGVDALKYFPAEQLGPGSLRIWRSVLPKHLPLLPAGGIATGHIQAYVRAGAAGFGLGRALYMPGMACAELDRRAEAFQLAWKQAHGTD